MVHQVHAGITGNGTNWVNAATVRRHATSLALVPKLTRAGIFSLVRFSHRTHHVQSQGRHVATTVVVLIVVPAQ